MVSYLLDTNVVSELRKRERANESVQRWFAAVDDSTMFISVLVVGELRKGVERLRVRDREGADALDDWLHHVIDGYADRILPITTDIATTWGRFNAVDPLPTVDSLMAATAHVQDLTLVTRNVRDVDRTGVAVLNPFEIDKAV